MKFSLFIPYQPMGGESEIDNSYYTTEEDYVNALKREEELNGNLIFNAMSNGTLDNNTYYGGFSKKTQPREIKEEIAYAKAECTLYSPNGAIPETVDSIIDKFAEQKEYLVTLNLNFRSMDEEFYEEIKQWNKETNNIVKLQSKMGSDWVDRNIPKKNLKLSFLNKSNKVVNFILENSEIEEQLSKNSYLLYVKNMSMLKN